MAGGKFIGVEDQMKWKTETLVSILDSVIENGQHAVIHQPDYIKLFGSAEQTSSANALWQFIMNRLIRTGNSSLEKWKPELDIILKQGTLAQRIINAVGTEPTHQQIITVYKHLCDCLAQNRMFIH